jgi:hypothetical protein
VSQGLELDTDYYREAAGPLDPRAFYNEKIGIEALAAKRGYFLSRAGGRAVKYFPSINLPTLLRQAPETFGQKWQDIVRLIGVFRALNTEQCEIVATLYACWNDLLLEGRRASDDMIVQDFLMKWHERKRRFTKQRLINALGWMRDQKLVPKGRGKHPQMTHRRNALSVVRHAG